MFYLRDNPITSLKYEDTFTTIIIRQYWCLPFLELHSYDQIENNEVNYKFNSVTPFTHKITKTKQF
jgi:hypothetical protein